MATISVGTPILNEFFFLPFWFENIEPWADEILLIDGGSTDGSWELIQEAKKYLPIKCTQKLQQGKPYSEDWSESTYRNWLLDNATMEYFMPLDSDEVLSDNILSFKNDLKGYSYALKFVSFWENLHTVRLNHPNDPRWEGHILRLWKNDPKLRYSGRHHCRVEKIYTNNLEYVDDVIMFHLHYGFHFKERDNRRADVGYGHTDKVDIPDWNFLNKGNYKYNLVTEEYKGKYPKAIERLVK